MRAGISQQTNVRVTGTFFRFSHHLIDQLQPDAVGVCPDLLVAAAELFEQGFHVGAGVGQDVGEHPKTGAGHSVHDSSRRNG
ncbi:hypothetical protein D9M68_987630 [compost metagenome]